MPNLVNGLSDYYETTQYYCQLSKCPLLYTISALRQFNIHYSPLSAHRQPTVRSQEIKVAGEDLKNLADLAKSLLSPEGIRTTTAQRLKLKKEADKEDQAVVTPFKIVSLNCHH